jgi:NlpC/P60 family putative phage cell wall peptidase
MDSILTRFEIVATARAWIGTPYILGAALRGVGADCVGLIRGVLEDVTGRPAPVPPGWRPDWSASRARPLIEAARLHLIEIAPEHAQGGDVVAFRLANGREAHCGILTEPGRILHAVEGAGVVEVPLSTWRKRITFAAQFPGLS